MYQLFFEFAGNSQTARSHVRQETLFTNNCRNRSVYHKNYLQTKADIIEEQGHIEYEFLETCFLL